MKKILFSLFLATFCNAATASSIVSAVKNEKMLPLGYEKCVYLLSKFGETYEATLSEECTLSFGVKSAFYEICKHNNNAAFSLSVKHDKIESFPEKFNAQICKEFRETSRQNSEQLYRLQVYSGVNQASARYRCGDMVSSSIKGDNHYYEFMGPYSSRIVALSRVQKLSECGIESWLRPKQMSLE